MFLEKWYILAWPRRTVCPTREQKKYGGLNNRQEMKNDSASLGALPDIFGYQFPALEHKFASFVLDH